MLKEYNLDTKHSLIGWINPLKNNDGIPENLHQFTGDYDNLYTSLQDRIEGLLMERVFFRRLKLLKTTTSETLPWEQKKSSEEFLPDAEVDIDSHKIGIEFKSRHFFEDWLILDGKMIEKYKIASQNAGIEHLFILHSPYAFDSDPLLNLYILGGENFYSPSTDSALTSIHLAQIAHF